MYKYRNPSSEPNADYVYMVTSSLKKTANIEIVDFSLSREEQAEQALNADYVLLAHDASAEPHFTYANRAGLKLFEMSWEEFTKLPSKYSAESDQRTERERALARVAETGYTDDYSGIRVSKTGRRFKIQGALLWNVFDTEGKRMGQAAMFRDYEYL